MMVKVILWVYRSYYARGFSNEYFKISLNTWIKAIETNLHKPHAKEIVKIYNWILGHHENIIELAKDAARPEYEQEIKWHKTRINFTQSLILGDSRACFKIAEECVLDREDVKAFYLQVIQPAMYEIGQGWEIGEISIAQEHLASAIIARVMTNIYHTKILEKEIKHKMAIVTAAPNEFHEIGAHMVADFLELAGWNVYYLGANTPAQEIITLAKDKKPFVLAISVTMPFNLENVKRVIEAIREDASLDHMKIIVGGLSFTLESLLWKKLGADGWAINAQEAVELADKWHEQERGKNVQ